MHEIGACLTETDMIFGAGFGTVPDADSDFLAFQPSHRDDFRNASEPIGLDTCHISSPRPDDSLMAIR
ncbi:hypothetical protein C6C11_11275 [Aeromonas hydrophila]|uniref:Uncharacterized protein n=1 Tax=Aeromonas hydrophila TaxID=644 RepID=A0ABD7G7Q3_AERHY|nr:hypothetical protein C6C11_11275 [Aeromonas hydrophila]